MQGGVAMMEFEDALHARILEKVFELLSLGCDSDKVMDMVDNSLESALVKVGSGMGAGAGDGHEAL
jgi:hypothetical protein